MKRTSAVIGEAVENVGYTLIGAALLASAAMAFSGAPLAARALQAPGLVKVRLEGLVVTPSRTYSASEWAKRPASARRVASNNAKPRVCELPKPSKPLTLNC